MEAASTPHRARVAVLFGSELRDLHKFASQKFVSPHGKPLFAGVPHFDMFISSDNASLRCLQTQRAAACLRSPDAASSCGGARLRWREQTPDPQLGLEGLLGSGLAEHRKQLIQLWRLLQAYRAMEEHERHRALRYAQVVKLRTDLHLPVAIDLLPAWEPAVASNRAFFMRSDWIFWGSRDIAARVIEGFFETARLLTTTGDQRYWPLDYRSMLEAGSDAWDAGKWSWLRYPRHQPGVRPFGLTRTILSDRRQFFGHLRRHVDALERWDRGCALNATDAEYERNGCRHLVTRKPEWFPRGKYPEPEKSFLYHVLSQRLIPRSALDVLNHRLNASHLHVISPFGPLGLLPSTRSKSGSCPGSGESTSQPMGAS